MLKFTYSKRVFFVFFSSLFFSCKYSDSYQSMKDIEGLGNKQMQNRVFESTFSNINDKIYHLRTDEIISDIVSEVTGKEVCEEEKEEIERHDNLCVICSQWILEADCGFTKCCNAKFHKDCGYNYILDETNKYLVCPNSECIKGFNFPISLEIGYEEGRIIEITHGRKVSHIIANWTDLGIRDASFYEKIKEYFNERGKLNIILNRNNIGAPFIDCEDDGECISKCSLLCGVTSVFKSIFMSPISLLIGGASLSIINIPIPLLICFGSQWVNLVSFYIFDSCHDFSSYFEKNGSLIKKFDNAEEEYAARIWKKNNRSSYSKKILKNIGDILDGGYAVGEYHFDQMQTQSDL